MKKCEKNLKKFGKKNKKIIDSFTDLLGYVAISTPILLILTEYISTNSIDIGTIPIKLIIIGCGAIIFIIKSVVETICVYEKSQSNLTFS